MHAIVEDLGASVIMRCEACSQEFTTVKAPQFELTPCPLCPKRSPKYRKVAEQPKLDATVDNLILAAILGIQWEGQEDAAVSEIVVRAWRMAPKKLGLEGHPEHPNSNRVIAALVRLNSTLTERTRSKHYRLTAQGTKRARAFVESQSREAS